MTISDDKPRLIPGGLHTDERGTVAFVNDFDFAGVRRFYMIRPARPGEVRGWIGHRREHKWFMCIQGRIVIAVVKPDRWDKPSHDLPVCRYELSANQPAVLHVPAGHATASMAVNEGAILLVYSSDRLEVAPGDDHRFAPETWMLVKPTVESVDAS